MKFLRDAGYRSDHTEALAQRYLDAGFRLHRAHQRARARHRAHDRTRGVRTDAQPVDTSRTPGGSSGGSAAAVASGMVAVAHANDGGDRSGFPRVVAVWSG